MSMGKDTADTHIPMLDLGREYRAMKDDIDRAVQRCLSHQQWILGPEVQEFEAAAGRYLDVRHCIGASSGTEALVLALRALAIKREGREYFSRDEQIITTPFTFTATGDAILRAGATPVFVDIDPATFNIDVEKAREYLERAAMEKDRHARVVGILPVHLYGRPCDMDRIRQLAEEHGLFVVEDVAQAFGGAWKGRKLGSLGHCGAFSFFPSKNLGAFGDAGMVATDDDELAALLRMLLKHGGKDKYNVEHIGYNARLDTLQAAVLLAKLKYVDEFNDRRRRIAEAYSDQLRDVRGIALPVDAVPCRAVQGVPSHVHVPAGHVFHQYTLRVLDGKRDALQRFLQEQGIASMIYYPVPLHKMKVFDGGMSVAASSLPQAETACSQVLSLPIEPLLDQQEAGRVVSVIRSFFD